MDSVGIPHFFFLGLSLICLKVQITREGLGGEAKNGGQSDGERSYVFRRYIQKNLFLVCKVCCISPNFSCLGKGQKGGHPKCFQLDMLSGGQLKIAHPTSSFLGPLPLIVRQNKLACHLGNRYFNEIETLALRITFLMKF